MRARSLVVIAAGAAAVVAGAPRAAAAGPCPASADPAYCIPLEATTGAASDVRATSATLTGTIGSPGAATKFAFDYGTTTRYGAQTAAVTAPAALSDRAVAAPISGLTPGTRYHYVLLAVNESGESGVGADRTFTTAKAHPRLTIAARPAGDSRAPFRYTIAGRLRLPGGVTAARACAGKVTIAFAAGRTTVSRATARLTASCAYSATVTVRRARLSAAHGRLRVTSTFAGTAVLSSASAARTVSYG